MTRDGEHIDMLGLLSGELAPALRADTLDHVRSCEQCRYQLADTAAVVGELKDAGRHSPVDPADVPRLDLAAVTKASSALGLPTTRLIPVHAHTEGDGTAPTELRRPPVRRRVVGLAAVCALAAAFIGGIAIGHTSQASRPPAEEVRLAAIGQPPTPATGAARMIGSGATQTMQVTLSGVNLPSTRDRVEVWLLNTRTGQTRPIGTMPVTARHLMTATFPLPASDLAGYDAIDVSIQTPADNGHSHNSILRGAIA
jgi:Anti-sigma-K factor rskA